MVFKKMFFIIVANICLLSVAAAKNAIFSNDDYSIALAYNDETAPGDAIFVHIKLTATNKKIYSENTTASMSILDSAEKKITGATFYQLSASKQKSSVDMLCGVALSSWQKAGAYTIRIIYTPFGAKAMTFDLPVIVNRKTFESETIKLDSGNTSIKTNESPERVAQVQKLSKILMTKNPSAIYHVQKFQPPTTATRRTAFWADRRVYAFSNGKSSTELHYGIDYGVPTGTPVMACASGKIVMAESRITTGWTIVIEHLPGLYSLYYHMDKLNAQEGQMVKTGDVIGYSGATGLATGPHLHWQMSLNGEAVNPDFFLNNFTFCDD